jgi:hypothetical protein
MLATRPIVVYALSATIATYPRNNALNGASTR